MVATQLVERSLPSPEIRGSNPVISKTFYIEHLYTSNYNEKTKIIGKDAGKGQFLRSIAYAKVQEWGIY